MSRPHPDSLPHGPAFLLVQAVDDLQERRITCTCRIPEGFPWGSRGRIPVHLALEGVAQASGLLAAHLAAAEGAGAEPAHGYVARIRTATFHGPALDAGRPWIVECELEGRSGHMVLCRGTARQGHGDLLAAGLALYI